MRNDDAAGGGGGGGSVSSLLAFFFAPVQRAACNGSYTPPVKEIFFNIYI